MSSPARQVAEFDSATAMLRVLARFLDGRDAPLLGIMPGYLETPMAALLRAVVRLPRRVTEKAYALSGWAEAVSPQHAGDIRSDALAEWIVSHYPRRRYPAVLIGSSDGALIHLAAALGIPWLPQTVLIPMRRRGGHPDDSCEGLRLSEPAGHALVGANPDLVLHHMHDANQDRLMIAGMSYFRVKWRRLPAAYRDFLRGCLAPNGTVIVTECELRWPTTQVGERYVFQHGAYGGVTAQEFHEGSPRLADFLARSGSPQRSWRAPAPDGNSPEAEWGFDRSLLADLADFRTHRLKFPEPQALSPAIADLYRAWYHQRGIPDTRLFASCFLLLEPWWTLRTGSVPYWLTFNTESSRRELLEYIADTDPYDEIRLTLFSNGVPALGQAPVSAWREVLTRARTHGTFTGVDTAVYPRDFAAFARMHQDLSRVRPVHPMPDPLDVDFALEFLARHPAAR
ncbi:hypothetical protein [Spirillospora sp. NPDC048819]|uniref:hypothetical protein n=1 Tax=Spirillospora sp. NPDC048819 TaxID=3155268 RepID=UPI0033E19F32